MEDLRTHKQDPTSAINLDDFGFLPLNSTGTKNISFHTNRFTCAKKSKK